MGLRFVCARAASALSAWGLKNLFHRPAANFPGKLALYLDSRLIAHLAPKLKKGSIVVVGTNGKTTTTNLLANALELAGERVVCNRTGANLDSGVASVLLKAGSADWGVFESDELWLAKILPQLQANYVVLLNLFRDQLDRVGEIDRIQDSIVGALSQSPGTRLVYNADDPLCAAIAQRCGNRSVAFGVGESMKLSQNSVSDAQMCQNCSTMLAYAYRQYGQLGDFACPSCGFARPALEYAAHEVRLKAGGLSFGLRRLGEGERADTSLSAPWDGAYMVYNLLATAVAADVVGCPPSSLQEAVDAFDPQNGRLQTFDIEGRRVLLNLAKNPTGFNQNLKIVAQDGQDKAIAFFVNDKEADGRDVSWLWDIDFEELAAHEGGLSVYAGGVRGNDMQVRLKYAGVKAELVSGAEDLLARVAALPAAANAYIIANYTALPAVHAALTAAARKSGEKTAVPASAPLAAPGPAGPATSATAPSPASPAPPAPAPPAPAPPAQREPTGTKEPANPRESAQLSSGEGAPVRAGDCGPSKAADPSPLLIAHLFPDLLNLYGDGGNVRILEQRLRWRGIPVEAIRVEHGESIDLGRVDLVVLGGGPDREQRLASEQLMGMREDLRAFVEQDGVLLAICGGYQILGSEWLLGAEAVQGLGLVDLTTKRAPGGSGDRLIDNIALRSPLATRPVVGYENHAGRTYLGAGVEAFGVLASSSGHGNNDADGQDGARYKRVVGSYLHGPLLAKNPEVADALLGWALERRARRTGLPCCELAALDDAVEVAANEAVALKLGLRS